MKRNRKIIALILAFTMALSIASEPAVAVDTGTAEEDNAPSAIVEADEGLETEETEEVPLEADDESAESYTDMTDEPKLTAMEGYDEEYDDDDYYDDDYDYDDEGYDDYDDEGYTTDSDGTKRGECGDNATWALTTNGTMTIQGKGAAYEPDGWWSLKQSVQSVVIESGITEIDWYLFEGFNNLKTVSFPASLSKIDGGAFYNCTALESVQFSKGIQEIGKEAFYGCSSLKSVVFPSGLKKIDSEAFSGCKNLSSITFPDSIEFIGYHTFHDTPWLSKQDDLVVVNGILITYKGYDATVTIPSSVTRIAYCAFLNCSSLKKVSIPKTVVSIGGEAFENCSSLDSIQIPKSVTSIGLRGVGYNWKSGRVTLTAQFRVLGSVGSQAEQYAKSCGIAFQEVNEEQETEKAIQELNKDLAEKVEEVEKDPSKVEEVVEELKKEDQELIREAVTTNQETYEMIERLEEVYIQEKKIEVEIKAAEDAPLTQKEVKVVGAAFNAKPGASKVTVEITKPEKIGRLHDSKAKRLQEIGINIYSDNEKVEALDIPIAVTVPVPKKADVKKIRIYNFFSGNKIETMTPSVVTINKTKMLRFATKNPKDIVIATLVSAQKKYTVTLNANGGKMKIKKKTVKKTTIKLKKGAKYGKLPKPTRKKYKFQGWYTDKKKGKKVTAKTKMNTEKNTTLYARWKKA